MNSQAGESHPPSNAPLVPRDTVPSGHKGGRAVLPPLQGEGRGGDGVRHAPSQTPTPAKGAVLAFDFGTTKIGVAVGDWETRLAHPLEVIRGEANDPRFARIAQLIEEWKPAQLVAGLPLSLEGEEHDLTRRARRFAHQLHGRFRLTVTLVDERLTSVEADARLREAGLKAGSRKRVEDSVAAQQILQDLFDHVSAYS